MTSNPIPEVLQQLVGVLGSLAEEVAAGRTPTDKELGTLLFGVGLEHHTGAAAELKRWATLLLRLRENRELRSSTVQALKLRGVPEASALLAVEVICTVTEVPPGVGGTLQIEPARLDFGYCTDDQPRSADLLVRGGVGRIHSDSTHVTVEPQLFGPGPTKVTVTVTVPAGGILLTSLKFITPQAGREVPISASRVALVAAGPTVSADPTDPIVVGPSTLPRPAESVKTVRPTDQLPAVPPTDPLPSAQPTHPPAWSVHEGPTIRLTPQPVLNRTHMVLIALVGVALSVLVTSLVWTARSGAGPATGATAMPTAIVAATLPAPTIAAVTTLPAAVIAATAVPTVAPTATRAPAVLTAAPTATRAPAVPTAVAVVPTAVAVAPTAVPPTAPPAAPLEVESVASGAGPAERQVTLAEGEIVVGHAARFGAYVDCVAFLVNQPGTYQISYSYGIYYRWRNADRVFGEQLLAEQVLILETNGCTRAQVQFVRLPEEGNPPNPAPRAPAPREVSSMTDGGNGLRERFTLGSGELLVGNAEQFNDIRRCVVFALSGPATYDVSMLWGVYVRWEYVTADVIEAQIQRHRDNLLEANCRADEIQVIRQP